MARIGKRLKAARKDLNFDAVRTLEDAIAIIKKTATAKFDETVEISIMLGIDPTKQDQMIRGVVSLPNGTGKTYRVAVFAKDQKAEEAKAAGAEVVGAEDLVEMIQKGNVPFDRCIATPDMMVLVGKVGKILGPKGLMPNPKLGTVTTDVATAIRNIKGGQIEYRTEKGGIVHAGLGKVSFSDAAIAENVRALLDAVTKAKPVSAKGTYLKKVTLSSTMGVGIAFSVD
ncbi:MAG: 50S ribosomal protein L1 [Holosporales bacterium]|jgi:large subunit ribosomal protein L1|nr:50S ribosomal protein L1 [Holosporales bacterium]